MTASVSMNYSFTKIGGKGAYNLTNGFRTNLALAKKTTVRRRGEKSR